MMEFNIYQDEDLITGKSTCGNVRFIADILPTGERYGVIALLEDSGQSWKIHQTYGGSDGSEFAKAYRYDYPNEIIDFMSMRARNLFKSVQYAKQREKFVVDAESRKGYINTLICEE